MVQRSPTIFFETWKPKISSEKNSTGPIEAKTPEVWGFILEEKAYGLKYNNTFRSLQPIAGEIGTSAKYLGIYGQFVCIDNLANFEAVLPDLHCKIF